MEESLKSRHYHRIKTFLFFIGLVINLLFLFFFFYFNYSRNLVILLQGIFTSDFFIKAAYFSLFFLFLSSIKFIFSFSEDYILEKKFGLSNHSFLGWFKDFCKEEIIEFIILIPLLFALYAFLKTSPLWWFKIWLLWFFISFVLAKISPYVILPLFFKFIPLVNDELNKKIFNLAEFFKIKLDKIWVVDFSRKTKKANAFVTGLGKTKRVGLADNLLEKYTHSEIEAVVAHEFGHVRNRDTLKILFIYGGGSLLGFFLTNLMIYQIFSFFNLKVYDVSGLPLLLLLSFIFAFLGLPLFNALSRRMEKKADLLCLAATNSPESFISLFEKLAKDNLAEINPPLWKEILFYSHPPIAKRIAMAKSWKKIL